MVAADYYEKIKIGNPSDRRWGPQAGSGVRHQRQAAEKFEISTTRLQRAVYVNRYGDEALKEAVVTGELSDKQAHDKLTLERGGSRTSEIVRKRRRHALLMTWRANLRNDARRFPEFDDVWDAMRKRLGKIADFQASVGAR
jgi:hypothetical protein